MRIAIVTTHLANNPNIGDFLIATATEAALRDCMPLKPSFQRIFRAMPWEEVEPCVAQADFIVFACLAIRRQLLFTYPFLREIMGSGIPYGILAAGTSLFVSDSRIDVEKAFERSDRSLLVELASGAEFFTTRGVLTQAACVAAGVANATMCGDIAFYDSRFQERCFQARKPVRHIAVSDPHYAEEFKDSLDCLLTRLRRHFPSAAIDLLLHGDNPMARAVAARHKMGVMELYLQLDGGLDLYDDYDLHIGYRVHGHVSALNRRIPSYLLEQDGRGCDYGLTLSRRISVPHFRPSKSNREGLRSIELLMAMVEADQRQGFGRFMGLEEQIRHFNSEHLHLLSRSYRTLIWNVRKDIEG